MTATTLPIAAEELAVTAAAASGRSTARWLNAIAGAGGAERAAWLIGEAGVPLERMTPEALLVAHACASLLELGPRPSASPP